MRRVVITGMGIVSPVGCGVESAWKNLLAGQSGARRVEEFEVSDITCQIANFIPRGATAEGKFNPDDWMEPKEQRKVDDFIIYAVAAADQAIRDSGLKFDSTEAQERAGVLIGSGIGGLSGIADTSILLKEKGPRRVSPFFIPGRLINLAGGYVSIKHNLRGPNNAVVTACATGTHAIGDAARIIALDDADVMVAGGSESPICRIAMAGFAACRALSTGFNDTPTKASRPYDKDRDGFVMGEGAGVVVLESYEHAKARGATIHAEVIGYGMSADAFHITAPAEDGDGAYRCMKMALARASVSPSEIDYINAHGTSTPMGDEIELKAVERLFGNTAGKLAMSSTKSAIGHLLGAAGAVETIFSTLAIRDNVAPPTLNLDAPSVETAIDLVPHVPKKRDINIALSNSFGFGGTNACLVLRRAA
ncbi:3-oxoacyl-(acyl carrier protein) synthase II [Hyphomicrobium denitrificans 1NES1]|uniref:3-oxoacyl-[acyl-carrier-protein] synthase 2 n=1 Tax=Hyphomicrobium denitrificans 1NES1 TaxID=670307 RepID=N0BCA4_9HYPH|nr:beta-ketoacyl-ACP synthase II [Hyphomicrobium denitrificans]AGK57760.1 3-oxoacyl-(acyl carrier protein) synthase II [Hyphomicrobium denitrificans 1NES1]